MSGVRTKVKSNFPFVIDIAESRKLSGVCSFVPDEAKGKRPIAFILHGFKGNSEWGFIPLIRDMLAGNGCFAVSYNHSLNGFLPGSVLLDVEKFRRMTITSQLAELSFLIDHPERILPPSLSSEWNGEILLCGHSMGAAIALVFAGEHPQLVSKLAMLAPIASFNRYYTDRQIEVWRENSYLQFQNARTGQQLILDSTFLNDFVENESRFDLAKAIVETRSKILIAHGETDLTAKIAESEFLYSNADKTGTRFSVFPHCNHSFNFDMENDPKKNMALARLLHELKEFFGNDNETTTL